MTVFVKNGYRAGFRHRAKDFYRLTGLLLVTFVATLFLYSPAVHAEEEEFVGTVTNSDGVTIQYVAVDILGPRKIFTRTNSNGRFKVVLVKGRYTIRLRYKKTTTDFSIRIGGDTGIVSRTFVLDP
jgi:hypothetical protein